MFVWFKYLLKNILHNPIMLRVLLEAVVNEAGFGTNPEALSNYK